MQNKLKQLTQKLGYSFNSPALLKLALSHRSVGQANNERLEFLGDSILNFAIANALFLQFPEESEGQLSRLRAHLVKGDMLAELAIELDLGDHLILGQGELKSGGFRRKSTLADALEAVFAAIYLDGGLEPCQQVILKLYESRLQIQHLNHDLKDNKTRLQECLQAEKYALPNYQLTSIEGEEHEQIFQVTCTLPELSLSAVGTGNNRRNAEQDAAKKLLRQLSPLGTKKSPI